MFDHCQELPIIWGFWNGSFFWSERWAPIEDHFSKYGSYFWGFWNGSLMIKPEIYFEIILSLSIFWNGSLIIMNQSESFLACAWPSLLEWLRTPGLCFWINRWYSSTFNSPTSKSWIHEVDPNSWANEAQFNSSLSQISKLGRFTSP